MADANIIDLANFETHRSLTKWEQVLIDRVSRFWQVGHSIWEAEFKYLQK